MSEKMGIPKSLSKCHSGQRHLVEDDGKLIVALGVEISSADAEQALLRQGEPADGAGVICSDGQ